MTDKKIDEVLSFWFEEIDHSCWFKVNPEFDQELGRRFGALLLRAKNEDLNDWCDTALGRLAHIVVLDQFSRNIHRGSPMAFAGDSRALQHCLAGIESGADEELTPEQRSFFYLPLRHAEDLEMQELGLIKTREVNAEGYGSDRYAINHLEIIKRFDRFPHRNAVLGRQNTSAEESYLKDGNAGF